MLDGNDEGECVCTEVVREEAHQTENAKCFHKILMVKSAEICYASCLRMEREKAAKGILMTAMIAVFGIFGVDKFARPDVWLGWMPPWLADLSGISRETWLMITGGIEVFLAAALLFPIALSAGSPHGVWWRI